MKVSSISIMIYNLLFALLELLYRVAKARHLYAALHKSLAHMGKACSRNPEMEKTLCKRKRGTTAAQLSSLRAS
jgi:hypothetical protein